jgi:hypothetical protein
VHAARVAGEMPVVLLVGAGRDLVAPLPFTRFGDTRPAIHPPHQPRFYVQRCSGDQPPEPTHRVGDEHHSEHNGDGLRPVLPRTVVDGDGDGDIGTSY